MVDHMADFDYWWPSILTHALHTVTCNLFLMCLNWSPVFSLYINLFQCMHFQTVLTSLAIWLLPPWLNTQVLTMATSFYGIIDLIDSLGETESATVLFVGVSTHRVWAFLCWILLFCCHQIFVTPLVWILLDDLHLQIC